MATISDDGALSRDAPDPRATRALQIVGWLWLLAVGLLFLWQAVNYRWIMALLAEWQFDYTGRYYPTLTCLLLLLLFGAPGFAVLNWAERRRRRTGRIAPHAAGIVATLLYGVAGGCAAIALVALPLSWRQPGPQGPPQVIRADRPVTAPLREGPALLVGRIAYDRTAVLDEDVWLARRSTIVAPVAGAVTGNADGRFFLELDRRLDRTAPPTIEARRGYLRRDALPGELQRLYRYAGLPIAKPYYVLYRDAASLRWPYKVVASELTIAAICLALVGLGLSLAGRRRDREDQG